MGRGSDLREQLRSSVREGGQVSNAAAVRRGAGWDRLYERDAAAVRDASHNLVVKLSVVGETTDGQHLQRAESI